MLKGVIINGVELMTKEIKSIHLEAGEARVEYYTSAKDTATTTETARTKFVRFVDDSEEEKESPVETTEKAFKDIVISAGDDYKITLSVDAIKAVKRGGYIL